MGHGIRWTQGAKATPTIQNIPPLIAPENPLQKYPRTPQYGPETTANILTPLRNEPKNQNLPKNTPKVPTPSQGCIPRPKNPKYGKKNNTRNPKNSPLNKKPRVKRGFFFCTKTGGFSIRTNHYGAWGKSLFVLFCQAQAEASALPLLCLGKNSWSTIVHNLHNSARTYYPQMHFAIQRQDKEKDWQCNSITLHEPTIYSCSTPTAASTGSHWGHCHSTPLPFPEGGEGQTWTGPGPGPHAS